MQRAGTGARTEAVSYTHLDVYKRQRFHTAGKIIYCLCIPVLIRLFWGRGMFTFTYYNYRSIYEWGMLFLYLVLISCVVCIGNSRFFRRDRLLALIILLSVAVLPLSLIHI